MPVTKKISAAVALCLTMSSPAIAATPPLTKVEITKVFSSDKGEETISPVQYATVQDHGGTQLQITVREIGYAKSVRSVTLDGVIVSNSALSTVPLCGTAAAPTTSCTNGQIYIGYDRVYQIDGKTGGKWSITATNSVSPFNTINDWITIQ